MYGTQFRLLIWHMNEPSFANFKHKVRRRKGGTYPLPHLYGRFGLVRLTALGHDPSWVKA